MRSGVSRSTLFRRAAASLVIPSFLTFADLALTRERHTESVSCDVAALEAVCAANDMDASRVLADEEMTGWMIAQWYRVHREHGGASDRVAEALLAPAIDTYKEARVLH